MSYPVKIGTDLYWACCISSIGPTCKHREKMPEIAPRDRLKIATMVKSTAQLMAAHAELERRLSAGEVTTDDRHASHLTLAIMADVVTERHGLGDELDRIFSDETYAGTYHEALETAMRMRGVMLT